MLYTTNDVALHLAPIDLRVQLFIQQPTNHHIFPSYQVHPVFYLRAWLIVLGWSYNAFNRVG